MASFKDKSLQKGPACRQAGQTLLIVVLIMVISLTVGLSIASKTITNLRTTTEEADSAKALSAAETGVAQQLKTSTSLSLTGGRSIQSGTSYNANITSVSGTTFLVNNGNPIPQDEGVDVWLIGHNASGGFDVPYSPWSPAPAVGTLTIYWGDSSGDCSISAQAPAALEVVKITGTSASDAVSTRYAYDPCSRSNQFALPALYPGGVLVSGKKFYYSTPTGQISVTNGLLVRIIPLYTNTTIAVANATGNPVLPQQGSIISSIGTAGNVTRKINVVTNYFSLPSQFFTYGLFVPK